MEEAVGEAEVKVEGGEAEKVDSAAKDGVPAIRHQRSQQQIKDKTNSLSSRRSSGA